MDNGFLSVLMVCLFAALAVPAIAAAETETEYMAVLVEGQKIGHAVRTRAIEDNKVITTEDLSVTLARGGMVLKVKTHEKHIETPDGQPLGFEMVTLYSGIEQKTTGTVSDGQVKISQLIAGHQVDKMTDWPKGALLFEGLRLFQEKQGLKPGTTYQVSVFRPELLNGIISEVQIAEKTTIDLFGRAVELTETKMSMSVNGQSIEMVSYVDEKMKVMKAIVPMMGMQMEMLACDKRFAMSKDSIVDFLEKLTISSPVKLLNLQTIESAEYTLKPTGDKPLNLPVSSSQRVQKTDAGIIVTVTKHKPAGTISFPYKGDDPEILEALKPADYVQCDNELVIELAKRAVGDAQDAAVAAAQIEAFVDGYITQKDLSIGYASAAEVAQNRQGDCSEHAVLTAAMCRAVGIPARTVSGVVYTDTFLSGKNIFGGHMWTEVYLDGKWYGLDATRSKQHGFSPGHIALAYGNGDPADFFGLVHKLGCFEIEKIKLTKKQKQNKETKTEPDNGE